MIKDYPLESFMLPSRAEKLKNAAAQRTRTLTLVLDGVHDPHNLSAVVRSCEGFGLLEMYVVETHGRFQVSHKVCQGAEKWLDVIRHQDPGACAWDLAARGFELWAADPHPESLGLSELPWEHPIALVFGNEHEGVSSGIAGAARGRFHIPMHGFAQSFNVSVAAGIALAAAVGQREKRKQGHGDLSEEEQAALVAEWQRRSVKHAEKIMSRLNQEEREESRRDPSF
jgi:tRNA (guanosine-2'-O-)-methyltransferase